MSKLPPTPTPPTTTQPTHCRRWSRHMALALLVLVASCSSVGVPTVTESAAEPNTSEPSTGEPSTGEPSVLAPVDDDWFATGFLEFPIQWDDDESVNAGFSMYVAAWPFQQTYPGPSHQTGLPSTWLVSSNADESDTGGYATIEGGLGWWNDTRFATETPKFIMGGVARDFSEWANGPGAGAGYEADHRDWDVPQGKYGVAQLSPYVLWAPDGLNLEEGTNGELFGYGYQPLPIIEAQEQTAGQDIQTGDRSWTLFLSTGNFQGPVSFFIPNFFSKPALEDPSVEGLYFDSSLINPHRSVAMETQVIPAVQATGPDGASYARITQTQFPASDDSSSVILNQVASYSESTLWDPVTTWLDGGAVATGQADPDSTSFSNFEPFEAQDGSSYTIIYEGLDEAEEYPIEWAALAEIDVSDPTTFRYRWNLDLVERDGDSFLLPEYYRLDETADGKVWRPIHQVDVPASTGLPNHVFSELGVRNDEEPYVTPDAADSVWQSPGPQAGPFQAELGDGSLVTYYWYRFVDQPSIQHWDFSDEQLEAMQARVEQLHAHWDPELDYLAPPTVGELANLDPAIVVRPPEGMEVGYVPIVTRQELADN